MKTKNTLELLKFILSFLWQLPQNIIALIMFPFLGKKEIIKYDYQCYAFECSKMNGGISLGNFIFLSKESSKKDAVILHEYGHVKQSRMLGWLYLLIIGLPSLANAVVGFTDCYYSWYTESWANKLMGVKVVKNQYGCYAYVPKK
jgi:hypothetical protein